MTRILVIEHDPDDPLLRLGEWLTETGVELTVCRPHAGDQIPATLDGFDAVISMGGEMGARDDDRAPWLPATRALLSSAIAAETPTLGICLGAQLLAAAAGGSVQKGANGAEIGAYLAAKRDAAMSDPLFADLPMTPDVMHYHYDVVPTLPPGAVLLLSSMGYPNQAWRQGTAAWALQFHIEPTAEDVRNWARKEKIALTGRLGPALDDAEDVMGEVWREFAHRFVDFIKQGKAPSRTLLPVVAIQT
ncbi:type 1 glutamine amidotransferase [Nakamurella sp. GG22]